MTPVTSRLSERGRRLAPAAVLVLAGAALAGCGSSRAAPPTHADANFPSDRQVSASEKAQQRKLHEEVLARLHSRAPKNKPGVASFLPRSTTRVNRIVVATRSHPKLAIAGIGVELHLAGGETLATLNGPLYNNKYVGTNDPTVPAKFLLTFTRVHGEIPLTAKDFTVLDQQGNNIVPRIRMRGGGRMPGQLRSGHRLTLVLSTVISAGDGSIVYNPTGITRAGRRPLVGWDFIVEDD